MVPPETGGNCMGSQMTAPTHLFPALDAATEDALRESIQRFGILVPVLVDQHGQLVDGRHRVRIATELDIDVPEHAVHLPDDADARADALASVNDDRRQRMSAEQRREVVASLRESGHSQRAIADAVGVSRKTVRDDLEQVGGGAHVPDGITGQDGKRYPATRPKPDPEPKHSPIEETLVGREAADDNAVRQARAAREFAQAVAATTHLRPQLDHVIQSVLALDGDTAEERARNCLEIWQLVVAGLGQSRTLRRVK
jgi:ParB-like chromosome segregation protein Spo0J